MNRNNCIEEKVDRLLLDRHISPGGARRNIRKIALVLMVAVVTIASVSASWLSFYGTITTTVEVGESVEVQGELEHVFTGVDVGEYVFVKNKLINYADVGKPVTASTTVIEGDVSAVDWEYFLLPGSITLELDNKNTEWYPILDDYSVNLTFNPCCPEFTFTLTGTVMEADTDYVLIYYADQEDKFVNWGGNPALALATVTSDSTGFIDVSGSVDLNGHLPFSDDWNIGDDADYTEVPDSYLHGKGAKIWLVPSDTYDVGTEKVVVWEPDRMLFETDLVYYMDCDMEPDAYVMYQYLHGAVTDDWWETFPYTLAPDEEVCLFIMYSFSDMGLFTITSDIMQGSP